jgi:hypothetical protein
MRFYEVHNILYNGRLLTERTRNCHNDIGMIDVGINPQLLLPAKRLDLLG